jgi:hypothetical protein
VCDPVARCLAGLGVVFGLTACAMAEVDSEKRSRSDGGVRPEQDAAIDAATQPRDSSTSTDAPRVDGAGGSGGSAGGGPVDSALDRTGTDAVTDSITGPCQTPPGICVATLPVGWNLLLLGPNRSAPCPANFVQQDVVSDPMAGAGACDCSCTVGSAPSCTTGQMQTRYGTTTSCSSTGASINLSGSGCTALSGNLSSYFSATPPPATATCTASPVSDSTMVTSTQRRACEVPSACREEVCSGTVPTGFAACIANSGDVPCPPGWSTRSMVGTAAALSCSACSCQASASCTDGAINFFSDGNCSTPLITFDVDGTCQPANGAVNISAFTYSATAGNPQCTANGPRTATVSLTVMRTVCCK